MKIDRSKAKRATTEAPRECKLLIHRIKSSGLIDKNIPLGVEYALLHTLENYVGVWTYGKCELYHWIDVLDLFDSILEKATKRNENSWLMACDVNDLNGQVLQSCVRKICNFTSVLIEHSFSRTVYNSMEHLAALLNSNNLGVVLDVLHLLYMFSKRSNFLTRLSEEKRDVLLGRLTLLAESWGGKDAGFGLAACCLCKPLTEFPPTATTVHLEYTERPRGKRLDAVSQVLHIENVHLRTQTPAEIMDELVAKHDVPPEKQLVLFTHIRLAYNFPKYEERMRLIQARLQALSILIYANAVQDTSQQLLYNGLTEELVDVLELDEPYLTDIKAATLKTLTAIIHLDRAQTFPSIIDATGAGAYHGFLPVMVRQCISSLISPETTEREKFPLPLATALFSFLYHLASYEVGGEALVNCGILESLLKVVNWKTDDAEQITFVTRAVRVIDLITNMDMQAFQAHNGLTTFINRLEMEVNACRKDQPFEIVPRKNNSEGGNEGQDESRDVPMDTDAGGSQTDLTGDSLNSNIVLCPNNAANFVHNGTSCLTQRAALLKSMLNFLKKVIQDPTFSDGIRHIMEGPLPGALKHIISNAEYYGPSLFILATDVVTVYVFQEPSLLSTLQDSGLTDVITEALIVKDVPPTREVISTMPNIFSALCLNNRGLQAFVKYHPFRKLFRMLISAEYLPAMRRKRATEPMGDTACNLGNAIDELMRHQPSLKVIGMQAMVELLEELSTIGSSPRHLAKSQFRNTASLPIINSNARSGASEGGSSEDEEDDDEETSTASHSQPAASGTNSREEGGPESHTSGAGTVSSEEKPPVPYMDFVVNVMKCLDSILSNNSTDDHCREFVRQGGLTHLMSIISKDTLPLDFPTAPACAATSSVCRSILTLAHEEQVLSVGLEALSKIMPDAQKLNEAFPYPGSSVLLKELANSKSPAEAVNDPEETPLLHRIISIHSMITMFINVCRTGQTDIRTMVVKQWGSEVGIKLLKELSQLYLNLVWESTVLLSLCSGDFQPGTAEFARQDLSKLMPPEAQKEAEVSLRVTDSQKSSSEPTPSTTPDPAASSSSVMNATSSDGMEVDQEMPVLVNSSTQTTAMQTQTAKEISGATLQTYAKLIKPVLSASSRLGRALTEFFGLLVKLCVGSPLRQRRGHHVPQLPGVMVPGAMQVASTLADLVTEALNWQPKPNSPAPRITFSICSVGFSAPLLFDEKKFPYHLMLRKFVESDGLDALFKMFYWAVSPNSSATSRDAATLSTHQVEFLEAWLNLIEKFSNPKTNLDSQHLSQTKSLMLSKTPESDANALLAHVHKKSFDAIFHLLGFYTSKTLGVHIVETILTILCHIFRFKGNGKTSAKVPLPKEKEKEKEVQSMEGVEIIAASSSTPTPAERSESDATGPTTPVEPATTPTDVPSAPQSQPEPQAASVGASNSVTPSPSNRDEPFQAAEAMGIDPSHLQHLMEMGFPVEMCIEALVTTSNLLLATDYLLSNGWATEGGNSANAGSSQRAREERRFTALLRLLGDQEKTAASGKPVSSETPSIVDVFENLECIKTDEIEHVTSTVFDMCLEILEKTPEVVFRVCELLVAVGQRNGMQWMEKILTTLASQIREGLTRIGASFSNDDSETALQNATRSDEAKYLGYRVHLFALMFDEMTYLCAMVVEQQDVLPMALQIVKDYEHALMKESSQKQKLMNNGVLQIPPWISPLILMIDLYKKACIVSQRKWLLSQVTDYQWKWFDINSGKWSQYSAANNMLINKAFWDGESTVRITAGRRKYVINFNAMIQLNEETSNRRPITLWLKEKESQDGDSPEDSISVPGEADTRYNLPSLRGFLDQLSTGTKSKSKKASAKLEKPPEADEEKEMPYVRKRIDMFRGLPAGAVQDLIRCSVSFMKSAIEPDFLHAVMRLCLRITREHELAVMFANLGGVQALLELNQNSNFPGVLPLSNLLIRHVIEDPGCLRYAVEKMIRAKVLSTGASTCRELHYLLRVLAPIACRCPDLFVSVAKDILQIDLNFVTRRDEDMRLIVKTVPCKQESLITSMGDPARKVIHQLLVALTLQSGGDIESGKATNPNQEQSVDSPSTSASTPSQTAGGGGDEVEPMETESTQSKSAKEKTSKNETNENLKKRKLIPKDAICQLLAESVHSYSYSCKIIAEYSFQGGTSPYVSEDCTALAFLLDKMLPPSSTVSDKDCSNVVRDLISAMAGCNHLPDAQAIVVSEVKASLQRALATKECPEKHNRIQALAGLICNMIEGCPSGPATQMVTIVKPTQLMMNQVVRLLIRKNVVVDLTRISHSLDLSSPQMAATINAALKPLEVISRIVNQPVPANLQRPKPKPESTVQDSANNTNTAGTSNSELTHAQGEETIEDADNTEHDISAAAESLLDATSESHTHHDVAEEREDDVLDDIMDHLLERDPSAHGEDRMLADALLSDAQSNRMETEPEQPRDNREYGEGRYGGVDHDDNDSSDSDSDDSEGDDDDDDADGNGNNVGEEEEEDEDDDDEDDEEDGISMDDRDNDHMLDEGFMRFPGMDRDEDLLVVQYAHDENTPVFFTNNASYNFNVGLFDDPLIGEHASGLRLNHPLLTPNTNDPPNTGTVTSRGHRVGRSRRFQYIQLPRNPPPSIQRLLGPSTAQDAMQFTSGQSLNQPLTGPNSARVLMLDAASDPAVARNGTSGGNGYLSNYTALHWWCEEAKVLDGESMHDCVIALKKPIVITVEMERDKAFQSRREKKSKDMEEANKRMESAVSNKPPAAATETTSSAPPPASENASGNTESDSRETDMQTDNNEVGTQTRPLLGDEQSRGTESNTNQQTENNISNASSSTTPTQVLNSERNIPTGAEVDEEESDMDVAPEEPVEREQSAPASATSRPRSGRNSRRQSGAQSGRGRRTGLRSSARLAAANLRDAGGSGSSRSQGGSPQQSGSTSSEPNVDTQMNQLSNPPTSDSNTSPDRRTPPLLPPDAPLLSPCYIPRSQMEDNAESNNQNQDVVAGPSGTQNPNSNADDFRNILGDIDIPEGVDPSFLAALPEDMRMEVIAEHTRLQRLRQRSQVVAQEAAVTDISPDFLAALPPNIQEEVLAQQRLEQQRRQATASNPNDPVDTEAFFRNLQPSLRQAILADMEESQIAVLPPELASEAQNLRREWESRNRQLLHERFFTHGYTAGSALSSILRNTGMRITSRFGLQSALAGRSSWTQQWPRGSSGVTAQHMLMTSKIKGKQLVDNEALSCLLVLLFLDDPRLNTGRLHRVLRNLCYHQNTRQWVIRSLLSVMDKANECSRLPYQSNAQQSQLPALPAPTSSKRSHEDAALALLALSEKPLTVTITPSWLNLSLDAALGCRASVFEIQKTAAPTGKRCSEIRTISVHAQAVPSVTKHTLDVLSNLAKSFPTHFLPTKGRPSLYCHESSSRIYNIVDKNPPSPPSSDPKPKPVTPPQKKPDNEFWDILLKLDSATSSRKGKHVTKAHSSQNSGLDPGIPAVSFEASPFGQLINMLSYGCIRRSTLLTDKLLRLLSLISLGIPDASGYGRKVLLEEPEIAPDPSLQITESHLRLIVEVITSKNCTEEGLEDATSLLLNLSYGPPATRDKILNLLLEGVRELGNVVCTHIASLQSELRSLRKTHGGEASSSSSGEEQPSHSGAEQDMDKHFKGTLTDRFTKDTVVIQANNKNKPTYELQLPSMVALTSKTSSQAFFLRLLKVIISLRESIEQAIKKHKQMGGSVTNSGPLGGPLMSSTVLLAGGSNTQEGAANRADSDAQRAQTTTDSRASNEHQPMDVDQEPVVASAQNAPRLESMVGVDESSDDDDDDASAVVYPPSPPGESDQHPASSSAKVDNHSIDVSKLLPRLSSQLDLDKLWETLSECLLELGHTPDHHAVLVLQPAVEAFFLVHASSVDKEERNSAIRESREAQLSHLQQELPPVSPIQPTSERHIDSEMAEGNNSGVLEVTQANSSVLNGDTKKFLKFAETHRRVLNQILRQSSSSLAEGPFSVLVDHTRVLDFDVKRRYFRSELERLDEGVRREDLAVHVRRNQVFEDSFREIHRRSSDEWKNRFYIVFEGEEGQDAGGLLREWYVIISREIFNPMYALFTISPGDRVTYMINQLSYCNPNHLFYFKFVGRVIAKAIYDNKLLECYFTRSFYKHILGKSVRYTDMESEDYSFYQGLAFLMENNVADLGYDLTFSTEVQEFGVTEVRDLIPNGRNIPVSEENKMEYIRLVCQMKMTGAIRKQLNAFLEGFYDIIPKRLISIFNEQELELLISGLPNIDIEDLKANTEYHKYQANSLQIQWFWRALRSFDQADRAKFLQFVTGTSKVPLQGFGALEGMNGVQKFQIHRDDRSTDRLPSAHTCFNQLDLPVYETYDKLRSYLSKAIHECSEGFGFA